MPTTVPPSRAAVWTNLWLVYLIWGSTYLGIAIAIETAQPLWSMAIRLSGAGALMALILALTRGPRALRVPVREAVSASLLGVMMLTGGIGVVALAERYVPIGVAALLVATSPLMGVVLRSATGDRPHVLTWVGIAVGLLGLGLLLRPSSEGFTTDRLVWSGLILLGQILWAAGSFLTPKLRVPRDPLVLVSYEMFFGGLCFFLWSRLINEQVDISVISTRSWLALAYLTVAGVVGYGAFTWLITHVPLSLAMTYAYVNPIVALTLGWFVLHQEVSQSIVIGGVFTLVGVGLVITGERSVVRKRTEAALVDSG